MRCKRFRLVFCICDMILYIILFHSPLTQYLPFSVRIASSAYVMIFCFLLMLVGFLSNKIAKKRGEELPYPHFPWIY